MYAVLFFCQAYSDLFQKNHAGVSIVVFENREGGDLEKGDQKIGVKVNVKVRKM